MSLHSLLFVFFMLEASQETARASTVSWRRMATYERAIRRLGIEKRLHPRIRRVSIYPIFRGTSVTNLKESYKWNQRDMEMYILPITILHMTALRTFYFLTFTPAEICNMHVRFLFIQMNHKLIRQIYNQILAGSCCINWALNFSMAQLPLWLQIVSKRPIRSPNERYSMV